MRKSENPCSKIWSNKEREKKHVKHAKVDFIDPNFLENEIKMVEKDNRRIEKEEMSRGDASNEDCVKNKKKEWATRK